MAAMEPERDDVSDRAIADTLRRLAADISPSPGFHARVLQAARASQSDPGEAWEGVPRAVIPPPPPRRSLRLAPFAVAAVLVLSLGLNGWQAYQVHEGAQTRRALATVQAELQAVHAQLRQATRVTDLRQQAYTPTLLAQALFPAATRSWGPEQPASPSPARVILPLYFAPGSAVISPASQGDLEWLGRVLTEPQYAGYRIQLEGHADGMEAPQEAVALAQARAEHVKQCLVQHFAVAPERLLVQGAGASQPHATNTTVERRSQNRRVEVANLGRAS
jgi:outer membrane protein OmpA-like peptidoglycan-associated protein